MSYGVPAIGLRLSKSMKAVGIRHSDLPALVKTGARNAKQAIERWPSLKSRHATATSDVLTHDKPFKFILEGRMTPQEAMAVLRLADH